MLISFTEKKCKRSGAGSLLYRDFLETEAAGLFQGQSMQLSSGG
jgi:hypothetical protein